MIIKELQYLKLVRELLNTRNYICLSYSEKFKKLLGLDIPFQIIYKAFVQLGITEN